MSAETLPPPKLLLDMGELGQVIGLKKSALYDLLRRGQLPIPVFKVGRSPRVRLADVENYLEQLADDARADQADRTARRSAIRPPRPSGR